MPRRVYDNPMGDRVTHHYARHPRGMLFNQNYTEIRDQCLSKGVLFEDPYFPAVDSSLFFKNPPNETIYWNRPHEICRSVPVWMEESFSRFDVVQGYLGDCWLLAAVASLTCNQRLFERVVPPDQSFQDSYCGVFRFRLWYQGEWVDVVVDDRLPTFDPEYPQLFYMHSANRIEFWSALLEKAYAKLYGCYECLQGGNAVESLEDLTGGLAETVCIAERPDAMCLIPVNKLEYLKKVMVKTLERGGLLTCSMNTQTAYSTVDVTKSLEGLLYNHAYSVTDARQVILTDGTSEFLVRVRNPWGDGQEWRGDWSDKSKKWNLVPQHLKRQMSVKFEEDGEFWLSLDDFTSHFTKIDMCNLDPLYIEDDSIDSSMKWDVVSYHKAWIKYVNAGGCLNYRDSMWKNPQFRVSLTNPDEPGGNLCTMIVALFQKDRRRLFKENLEFLNIGYVIYKMSPGYQNQPLDENYFRHNSPVGKSGKFVNYREVCGRHQLPPGDYVIIPSTFEPEQEAHFLLRIFTEKHKTSREIDEETMFSRDRVDSLDVVDGENEELGRLTSQLGETDEIDPYQLMDILQSLNKEFPFSGFTIETCRSMVAMNDNEMTGRLDYGGYEALCRDLLEWKAAFETTDGEKKGRFSSYSLRPTLHSLGYSVSNGTLQAMVLRYVNKDGDIEFPDFILSLVKLKTFIATFEKIDFKDKDSFVQATLYS